MGRRMRFGVMLVVGGAVALAVGGCGAQAAPSPQRVAIATVSKYMKAITVGKVGDFTAKRDRDGTWLVTFSGEFAVGGKADPQFVAYCTANHLAVGTKVSARLNDAGRQMVSKNGRERLGQIQYHPTGKTSIVECPAP